MVNRKRVFYITQWYRTIEVRLCYRLALQERRHLGLVAHGRGGGAPWTTQRLQLSHSDSLQSAIHSFDSISHLKSTVPSTFR